LAQAANFYDDEESDDDSDSDSDDSDSGANTKKTNRESKKRGPVNQGPEFLDDDHRLLLRCTRPLLQSQNAGVVLAVASLHWYLAPIADVPRATRALIFAARTKPECQHVLLKNAVAMAAVQPRCFKSHFEAFFIHPEDHMEVRALKLEMLTYIVTAENAPSLLRELQAYLRSSSQEFVALTIRAVGRCAAIMPQIASICIRSLLELSLHPSETVAGEAVVVIRALVQKAPKEHASVVATLVRRLDQLLAPAARSAVVWLAGGELFLDQNISTKEIVAAAYTGSSMGVAVAADGWAGYKKL
jgi:AP-3 complex subunit beta